MKKQYLLSVEDNNVTIEDYDVVAQEQKELMIFQDGVLKGRQQAYENVVALCKQLAPDMATTILYDPEEEVPPIAVTRGQGHSAQIPGPHHGGLDNMFVVPQKEEYCTASDPVFGQCIYNKGHKQNHEFSWSPDIPM